jgi:hypothetical protein
MQRYGGRLYGIANTGQQEYDDAVILKGEKPSVSKPSRTFLASLAKFGSKSSKAFHASVSDGCTINFGFARTLSLCHLMCLAVFFDKNNRFNRGIRGM